VNLDEHIGTQLKKWLLDFTSGRDAFLVDIRNFGCFAPKVVFAAVTPSESLSAVRKDLEDFLVTPGIFPIKREERSFHPHITLANRDLARKDFGSAWAHFQHLEYEASFRAENISLLKHNGKFWEVDFTTPFRLPAG
jgi:2'-5' RNA ligase